MSFSIRIAVLALVLATGAGRASATQIVDAAGQTVSVADNSRIVSIGGSVTEIIYALGEADRIVAVDSTSTYPAATADKPNVGYMRALSAEGILSVGPSLILAVDGAGPPDVLDVLANASVPLVNVPNTFTGPGITEKIRFVAKVLGVPEKGEDLAARVNRDLDDLNSITRDLGDKGGKARVLFVLSLSGGSPLASGRDTAASGILELAGAENAVEDFTGYKPLSHEAVVRAAPQAILMMARDEHGASADEVFSLPAMRATPAADGRRLITMDGLYMLGFGPRTAAAARELAATLYGAGNVPPATGN